MIHKLKIFGLAVVAVLAMSALGASAAQAQNTTLTPAGGAASTLDAVQLPGTVHTFAVGSREFTCENTTATASIAGNTTTVTITPTYENCHTKPVLGVSFKVTVTMNSCDFELHGTPTAANGTFETHATILCTVAGDKIEIDVYKVGTAHEPKNHICTLTIAPQTAGGTNQIHNVAGSPDDIVLTTNATVNVTIHGTTCGETAPAGSDTNMEFAGTYKGETTIRATQGGIFVNLTASHT